MFPTRGEMSKINNKRIYVFPDFLSYDIGFYDLSSFGTPPIIKSQSSSGGYYGTCGFMGDNAIICATYLSTGDIYKYDITNNYKQLQIASNNPSGYGFQTLLVTKDKEHILASYKGCIYIYTKTGTYVGYSDSSHTDGMFEMKEIRENIIITAESRYVHSHDIRNIGNPIINKLLEYKDTRSEYMTLEVLEGGDIVALGGYYKSFVNNNDYGYVELFHLDQSNSALQSIHNKRWVGLHIGCWVRIIREIQIGVIIFAGEDECLDICAWEYAKTPNKYPTCFPIGGTYILDLISIS